MKIVKQSWSFEVEPNGEAILKLLEACGRTCYKSEGLAKEGSAPKFVKGIMSKHHESVIEHASVTVRIITDRGVTHEIVRHRLASYSQESTRYCNYSSDKFGNEINVILPVEFYKIHDGGFNVDTVPANLAQEYLQYLHWRSGINSAEESYFKLTEFGCKPQLARSVLPNSLKTEIVMTANLREWRHFFKMRCSPAAHPQMRALALDMLRGFMVKIPVIFDDLALELLPTFAGIDGGEKK